MSRHDGKLIATVDGETGEKRSYDQVQNDIRGLADAFRSMGMKAGDKILIHSTNHPQYFTVALAALLNGGIVSTSSPSFTTGEIVSQIQDSGSSWVVFNPVTSKAVLPAIKETNISPSRAFTLGKATDPSSPSGILDIVTLIDEESSKGRNVKLPVLGVNAKRDVALLPYSSGTTGKPKGVMLSHSNITSNVMQYEGADPLAVNVPGKTNLMFLPYFHVRSTHTHTYIN
jgi:4-coumarate--CoA ligase